MSLYRRLQLVSAARTHDVGGWRERGLCPASRAPLSSALAPTECPNREATGGDECRSRAL